MKTIYYAAGLTLGLAVLPSLAQAETLRLAHVWPGGSKIDTEIFQAWADSVEEASDGRLEVQVFPGQTLAKSDATYEAVVDGIADIGATAQGYTSGRFPLTQVVEVPGVSNSSRQGSCVLQKLYDQGDLDQEYSDSHVLFMFTTGPGYLHAKEKLLEKPSDLEGMRLRRPTSLVGDMMEDLGAQPVGMPAPDIYTSLQRGVMDGLSINWEGAKTFRVNELVNYHTEVPLYDLALIATMNKDDYENLPDDLKKVVDEHSGMEWSMKAASVYDELIKEGRQEALDAGDEIITIDNPLQDDDWGPVLKDTVNRYVNDLQEEGLPGAQTYDNVMTLKESCDA
ncbi:TRAP transporter substrate-binding protein [Chromohalobacter moromii]|uniref:TRAP transporter substrate-binding protein n=1 Tax=Chromohalobacter moromii TaxID=2860329 RepID=A0A9X3B3X2_9GAMM|nr:TRAP transporter substrate-binding protein [Chromohalobacter moromii]MCK2046227.1 TRAP transporter substrate-binding protein [Chromohalobacter moromii]MCT8505349.1 TRAP transporter substrate-binding protein [Chromohalobacter moromii]